MKLRTLVFHRPRSRNGENLPDLLTLLLVNLAIMGLKVNIFLAFCLAYGVALSNLNMTSLAIVLAGFVMLYKNFKVWQFTGKFPGRNFTPDLRTFFGNTAANFQHELDDLWMKYGRDKFIVWIGFERFITVSKMSDVKVRGAFVNARVSSKLLIFTFFVIKLS